MILGLIENSNCFSLISYFIFGTLTTSLFFLFRIDKKSSATIAIKIVEFDQDEDDIEEIQAEIKTLSKIDCDNVTRYYGSYLQLSSSKLWIIMDFCGGGSIRQLVQSFFSVCCCCWKPQASCY